MDTLRESPEQPAPRRRGLIPIDRRQFGKVAAALGFHAAFGGWYTTLRDGEVPTLERVVARALAIGKAEAAKPAKYKLRCGTSVSKKTEEVMKFGRSEEHTSELQSRGHLVCRLLL